MFPSEPFYIQSKLNPDYVIDIYGNSDLKLATLITYPKKPNGDDPTGRGIENQLWIAIDQGSGWFRLMTSMYTGYVIDNQGGIVVNSINTANESSQLWKPTAILSSGWFLLFNQKPDPNSAGYVIDVNNSNLSTPLISYPANSTITNNQSWRFVVGPKPAK